VLVTPSHPGNIGAAARALKAMGLNGLNVVAARVGGFRDDPAALALAANAHDVLQQAQGWPDLAAALDGVSLSFAMTGYPREFGPALLDLPEAAARGRAHLDNDPGDLAFVFGSERSGLTNADLTRCTLACAIDADPRHGSLNLAQAVQVVAYECRRARLGVSQVPAPVDEVAGVPGRRPFALEPAATGAEIEALFVHLEQALQAVGFLDPLQPRHLMTRLRRLFGRAVPSRTDVAILRGICAAMIEPKATRAGRRMGRPADGG